MYRITGFLKRNSAIGSSEFIDFLKSTWGDSVLHAKSLSGRLNEINIYLPLDFSGTTLEDFFPPCFDAMIELMFAELDDAVITTEQLNPVNGLPILSDYLDQADSAAWLGEVLPKKPDEFGKTRVRMTVAGHVIDGMPEEDAQKYWSEVHPVVAQTAPLTWDRLTFYRQVHGRRTPIMESQSWIPYRYFPMCADLGATSVEELLAAYDNEEYLTIVRPDEKKFSKPEEMLTFITREKITLSP